MPKRILVADDDPAIGDMLQIMLSDAGYEVEVHVDGQAVQQMAEPFPDLLFLDIRLSGTDGRTICGQLKSQEATRHLPIIILSAHKNTRQMAREAGADDFLVKPFEMGELALPRRKIPGERIAAAQKQRKNSEKMPSR